MKLYRSNYSFAQNIKYQKHEPIDYALLGAPIAMACITDSLIIKGAIVGCALTALIMDCIKRKKSEQVQKQFINSLNDNLATENLKVTVEDVKKAKLYNNSVDSKLEPTVIFLKRSQAFIVESYDKEQDNYIYDLIADKNNIYEKNKLKDFLQTYKVPGMQGYLQQLKCSSEEDIDQLLQQLTKEQLNELNLIVKKLYFNEEPIADIITDICQGMIEYRINNQPLETTALHYTKK